MGVATDLAVGLDPALLAKAAGYVLDPWQREVLQLKPRRLLLNCSRRSGKSLTTALLAMHQALYQPGSTAVVVARAQRQAAETIRECRNLYGALGRPVVARTENALSLELDNRSRILAVPSTEETIRGLGAHLLVLDEASRIPDALYAATTPFLATTNGRLALLSTPHGRIGFFWEAYRHWERDGWFYKEVKAAECPRITPEFLAEQRRTTGEWFYQQEWECQFNDSVTGAFRSADIEAALQEDEHPWNLASYAQSWNK